LSIWSIEMRPHLLDSVPAHGQRRLHHQACLAEHLRARVPVEQGPGNVAGDGKAGKEDGKQHEIEFQSQTHGGTSQSGVKRRYRQMAARRQPGPASLALHRRHLAGNVASIRALPLRVNRPPCVASRASRFRRCAPGTAGSAAAACWRAVTTGESTPPVSLAVRTIRAASGLRPVAAGRIARPARRAAGGLTGRR
jgi:hypothetical protein